MRRPVFQSGSHDCCEFGTLDYVGPTRNVPFVTKTLYPGLGMHAASGASTATREHGPWWWPGLATSLHPGNFQSQCSLSTVMILDDMDFLLLWSDASSDACGHASKQRGMSREGSPQNLHHKWCTSLLIIQRASFTLCTRPSRAHVYMCLHGWKSRMAPYHHDRWDDYPVEPRRASTLAGCA